MSPGGMHVEDPRARGARALSRVPPAKPAFHTEIHSEKQATDAPTSCADHALGVVVSVTDPSGDEEVP